MDGFGSSKKLTLRLVLLIVVSAVLVLTAALSVVSFAAWTYDLDTDYAVNGVSIGKWDMNKPTIPDKPPTFEISDNDFKNTQYGGIVYVDENGNKQIIPFTSSDQGVNVATITLNLKAGQQFAIYYKSYRGMGDLGYLEEGNIQGKNIKVESDNEKVVYEGKFFMAKVDGSFAISLTYNGRDGSIKIAYSA